MTNPLADQDLGVLIGVVAILSGHLLAEALPDQLFAPIRQRFANAGLLDPDADQQAVSVQCERLVGRLRTALGEGDEPT